MVNDVITHTKSQIDGIASVEDVRLAGRQLGGFSPDFAEQERMLKQFMYNKLYYHPEQKAAAGRAHDVVAKLFEAYVDDASLMPDEWQAKLPADNPERSRCIADFIAGMSDRFAIERCAAIYGERPEGLTNV